MNNRSCHTTTTNDDASTIQRRCTSSHLNKHKNDSATIFNDFATIFNGFAAIFDVFVAILNNFAAIFDDFAPILRRFYIYNDYTRNI